MKWDFKTVFRNKGRDRIIRSTICMILAILAFISPVWPGQPIEPFLGNLLIWAGVLEIIDGFRRIDQVSIKSAYRSGLTSLFIGFLLINVDLFQSRAFLILILAIFIIEAINYFVIFLKEYRKKRFFAFYLVAFIGDLLLILVLLLFKSKIQGLALSVVITLRIIGVGIHLFAAKTGLLNKVGDDVVSSLGLSGNPYLSDLAEKMQKTEELRAPFDRSWIITFIILLFMIHLGRMGLDRSFLGILSPLVAVFGDLVIALVITYGIIYPLHFGFVKSTRWMELRLWKWVIPAEGKTQKKFSLKYFAMWFLKQRMYVKIRFKKGAYSMQAAVRNGLRIGLPWSALLAAVMPVLGMSWYFDTENWASGVWDNWAAARTDTWRMAITQSTNEGYGANAYKLHPEGVNQNRDFSFIVIGDTGEGDPSQLVLKDNLVEVSNHPEVKFVVISSDVVYPSGTLKDYEKKFWLPFKGVRKPVYAIPGNHDYYDALDGFMATFYKPEAAKKAMAARANKDLNITSSTTLLIDEMIAKSDTWRKEYEVPAGFQTSPYFQITTDEFVFLTIETGVERQIDSLQRKWLNNVLDASKGKFVMVLQGHPYFAAGEYQGILNPDFDSTHRLLRKYKVPLVMAGDTHDLEYYKEPGNSGDNYIMHHFVNGGGGAYLSIGAIMTNPDSIPTKEYAFYPSHDPMVKKIEDNTAWYKYPAWWWTKKMNGWPFSAEWLSAMFDYNVSPYFQSFMEIKVMPSKKQIVLIPYSNHGRIKWREMTSTTGARPPGVSMDEFAEWSIPMVSQ